MVHFLILLVIYGKEFTEQYLEICLDIDC